MVGVGECDPLTNVNTREFPDVGLHEFHTKII